MAASKVAVYRSMKRLYKAYVRRCRRRNIFWELTMEQFQMITQKPCSYCKCPPTQQSRNYIYNGIDRKNDRQGYTLENSVPSCGMCNMIKGTRLSFEEMQVAMEAVVRFRRNDQGRR
jgi:hypothetical protein